MAKKPPPEIEVTTQQVCSLFGVTKAALTEWKGKGLPGYVRRNQWDLSKMLPWWLENIYQGPEDEDESVTDAKRRYWAAKADRERLKASRESDELVPRKWIIEQWCGRVGEVTSGLEALSDRLPPLVVGKDRNEISRVIKQEVWQLRDSYARTGTYCPTPLDESGEVV